METEASGNLFAGTAAYYARYRVGYPPAVIDRIVRAFGLDGAGRLLDLGCGTGQLAIPLRPHVAAVVGLDPSAEMLAEARRQAARAGVDDIAWVELPAEAVAPALGAFRLVAIAQAFHWMRRAEVLRRIDAVLEPEGGIALLGGGGSVWSGATDWEQAVVQVIQRWLGPVRRAGQDAFDTPPEPYEQTLARAGFGRIQTGSDTHHHVWDIPALFGLLYSTSFCRRDYLGDNAPAFEADLRRTLLALEPSGRFEQTIVFDHIFAWRA